MLFRSNSWMQIISVLCENVVQHAMTDRQTGKIRITGQQRNEHFIFTFSDNGRGIDPSRQDRIFEAFFSTQMNKNSGLGLALVYNLVTRHLGGDIQLVAPYFGVGSSFEIRLPGPDYQIG